MPTYKYQCTKEECKHTYEIRQSIKDNALTKCPICNKESLVKVLYAPMVTFKGNGWFATDGKY